jgi:hypothetical protein
MIDHSQCDHPRTSGARAKCRRGQAQKGFGPPLWSLGPPPKKKASKKEVWMGLAHHNPDRERNQGTTPRDRDRQCMVCTVELIQFKGTEPTSGRLLYVGERCLWRLKHAPDLQMIEV